MPGISPISKESLDSLFKKIDVFSQLRKAFEEEYEVPKEEKYEARNKKNLAEIKPCLEEILEIAMGVPMSVIQTTEITENAVIDRACTLSPADKELLKNFTIDGEAMLRVGVYSTVIEFRQISSTQTKALKRIFDEHMTPSININCISRQDAFITIEFPKELGCGGDFIKPGYRLTLETDDFLIILKDIATQKLNLGESSNLTSKASSSSSSSIIAPAPDAFFSLPKKPSTSPKLVSEESKVFAPH